MTAKNPTHPGDSLREFASEMGWSVNEFADKLGINHETAAQLLDGQCGIIAQRGVGAGAHWLERRRILDAPPSEI